MPYAERVGKKVAGDAAFAAKVEQLLVPPPPPKPSGEPVRLLAILQREARLLDFLMEDVSGAPDATLGAGVREVHAKAQAALKKHVTLEPVMPQSEGSKVTVPAGFDPSAIKVVGNVAGSPPFAGTLAHAGWRAKKFDLPKPAEGVDEFVLMAAEVEVS